MGGRWRCSKPLASFIGHVHGQLLSKIKRTHFFAVVLELNPKNLRTPRALKVFLRKPSLRTRLQFILTFAEYGT